MPSKSKPSFQAKPAAETKPPLVLMKVVNVFMKPMLRSGKGNLGNVLMLLTFTGRKSGKKFTTPVGYQREGDTITIFTDSAWWKNMEGGAPVSMVVKGQRLRGWAEPVTDKEEVLHYFQNVLREKGDEGSRELALRIPKGHVPTEEELRIMLRDRVILRIKVQGNRSPTASAPE